MNTICGIIDNLSTRICHQEAKTVQDTISQVLECYMGHEDAHVKNLRMIVHDTDGEQF